MCHSMATMAQASTSWVVSDSCGALHSSTADAAKACAQIKARGGKVTREAGPMKHGTTVIAFVEDPDVIWGGVTQLFASIFCTSRTSKVYFLLDILISIG